MLDLESIYLYFLSLKKITIKTIRGFFFYTPFYNKRFVTKIPSRFFFYPNPYLLSPFLNHKETLLKISKFEANYFWNNSKDKSEIVRCALAKNESLSENHQKILSKDSSDSVRCALASNL